MKTPVGKYFKNDVAHYFCYEEDDLFENRFRLVQVREHSVGIVLSDRSQKLKRSTRKAFMAAYRRTIEKLDEIVTIV